MKRGPGLSQSRTRVWQGTFAGAALAVLVAQAGSAKLVISGQIEAEEVHIGVPLPLKITATKVSEGDRVKAGQTLLVLDNSEVEAKFQGTRLALSALLAERDRLRQTISQLSSRMAAGGRRQHLTVSARLHTHGGAASRAKSVTTPKSSLTSALVGGQVQALDQEIQSQMAELQNAQDEQSKLLAATTTASAEAAEKSYSVQKSALHAVQSARLEAANKHGLFGFLLPKSIKKGKAEAIKEVFKAKEEALDQSYAVQQQGMKRVAEAQLQAMQEAFDAKKQALKQAYEGKRAALEQVASAMLAMQQSAAEQQKQIEGQLTAFQSELAGAANGAQPGLMSALAASQTGMLVMQLDAARSRLLAVQSAIATAQAGQLEAQARAKMLTVASPINGICATKNINSGELPIPGQTLITILNTDKLYLHAFVPENLLGAVKVGQKAHVKIDYAGAPVFDATVTRIDQQASFTPENVALPEDRVRQVFGVKLLLKDAAGYAKPGMPADAYFDQ